MGRLWCVCFQLLTLQPTFIISNIIHDFSLRQNRKLEKLDFNQLANWTKLHESLIENIKKQNKDFCLDAIEHLKGQFGGELDSFYVNVEERFND